MMQTPTRFYANHNYVWNVDIVKNGFKVQDFRNLRVYNLNI
jgi:hypothetical protein